MKRQLRKVHAFAIGLGLAILAFSGLASADPPSRVARLGYVSGQVSFSPAGDDDWVQASLNRPLTTGDRVWADQGSRAEMQIGGSAIRLGANTDVSILNLDDQIGQFQLTQGALNVRVRQLSPGQMIEVDTPNLAFTVRQPGTYRVEVDADGDGTTIIVRSGQGEVYGDGASYVIDANQPYRFTGTGLREYQYVSAPGLDDFDRWSSDRDRMYDNSATARYVSPEVIGYADLDAHGRWESDPGYGPVWVPTRVETGWAPYRDGHWVWVDPWGWTWVDDAPWGFAVSHYGRWAHRPGGWCWVPGPVQTRAYYAPALVAFVGGDNFQISISTGNVGGVAWFPLGPREVYRPSYHVSRGYFERVNVSNTVVNTTIINNYYNTTNVTNIVYANRNVPGAVVAVPRNAFVESRSVKQEIVRVKQETMVSRPVAIAPSVAPTERSVRGRAEHGGKPPVKALERTVVAREVPPAARAKFADQKEKLAANPGKPLDDDARRDLRSTPVAARPSVKVIAKNEEQARQKLPPVAAPERKSGDDRRDDDRRDDGNGKGGNPEERKGPQAPATVEAPRSPKQADDSASKRGDDSASKRGDEPSQVKRPPAQVARPPQEREPRDRRDRKDQAEPRDQRDQQANVQEPRQPAQRNAPDVDTPKARPPVARAPEQRDPRDRTDQPDQRDRPDQRANVQEPRRPPQQNVPDVAAPKAPPSVARPPEQRGRDDRNDRDDPRERAAPRQPQLPPRAQVTPPQPATPPAPPSQARPQQPPEPAPTVRVPKPPRQEGQASPDQPRRAPADDQNAERNRKKQERGDNRDDKK